MKDRAVAGSPAFPPFTRILSPPSSGGVGKAPEAGSFHTVLVTLGERLRWTRSRAICRLTVQYGLLDQGEVFGGRPATAAGLQFVGDLLPVRQRGQPGAFDCRDVHERIGRTIVRLYEPEAFFRC